MNVAVVHGRLSSPARAKQLASGDRMIALEVTVRPETGAADTVPVVWFEPSAEAEGWDAGQEVVVIGRVRRRFFRAGPGAASRTEVVAATVVPATRRVAVRKALDTAIGELGRTRFPSAPPARRL